MTDESENGPEPSKLRCLGGRPMPESIPADIDMLLSLPEGARQSFWEVLGPCLESSIGPDENRAVEAFAQQHEAVGMHVAQAIRGARFLLYEAAKSKAERHVFALDLGTLAGDRTEALHAILLPGYETAMQKIRGEILKRALADHGRLLVGFTWRVDQMMGSPHGRLGAPIAVLTFTYQKGSERSRETFYADLPLLQQLRKACDDILA